MISFEHTRDADLPAELMSRMRGRIQGLRVRLKTDSKFKRGDGVSVSGRTIWLPSKDVFDDPMRCLKMLAWGYVLCLDNIDRPFVTWLFRWYPRPLAILSVLSVLAVRFGPLWFISLLFLACLFMRMKGRAMLIARGYAAVIAINTWRYGSVLPKTKEWIVSALSKWPLFSKKDAMSVVDDFEVLSIRTDAIGSDNILDDSEAYSDLYEVITGINLEE